MAEKAGANPDLGTGTVDQAEIAQFGRIAGDWWDPNGLFKPLHQMNPLRLGHIRDQVVAHFDRDGASLTPFSGLRIVDVGCGGGLLSEPICRLGAQVTGIDAGEEGVEVAKSHAKAMGLEIDYRVETAEDLAASGETYDVVLALEIIEHVAEIDQFVAALADLTSPGGLVFLSTLNRTRRSYLSAIVAGEYVLRWLPRGTHDWRKFVRPSELAAQLRGNGLDVQDISGMIYNPVRGSWSLSRRDLAVNYIAVASKAN
ncbi:MAG: bifunctional 2-polyprenyl-6-hydroxyphenol methylase/3-demethylubiquinol 3-O-methyltransferase UbiG [Pseudomonadota bacterium]